MDKILLLLVIIFSSSNVFASQYVNTSFGGYPTRVCNPNDTDTTCSPWQEQPGNTGIATSQNVGISIGTAAPGGALDMGTGKVCLNHTCRDTWPSSGSTQWSGISPITYTAGYVGIGTLSPQNMLQVQGETFSTSNVYSGSNSLGAFGIALNGFTSSYDYAGGISGAVFQNMNSTGSSGINFADDTKVEALIQYYNSGVNPYGNKLVINTVYGQPIVMSSNVGIGTLNPANSLDVAGSVSTSGNDYSGTYSMPWENGVFTPIATKGFGAVGSNSRATVGASFQNTIPNGYSGIGMINNFGNLSGVLVHGNYNSTFGSRNIFMSTDLSPILINTAYTNQGGIQIDATGNVGVGTPNPQVTLDVAGSAHSSNNLIVDGNVSIGTSSVNVGRLSFGGNCASNDGILFIQGGTVGICTAVTGTTCTGTFSYC